MKKNIYLIILALAMFSLIAFFIIDWHLCWLCRLQSCDYQHSQPGQFGFCFSNQRHCSIVNY